LAIYSAPVEIIRSELQVSLDVLKRLTELIDISDELAIAGFQKPSHSIG